MMQEHIVHLIQVLIERGNLLERLLSAIFRTSGDSLTTILEGSFIFIIVNLAFWGGIHYYETYTHANNNIFQGYDNSHTLFLNQYLWNPLNLNIHMTPWHPFNPFYQRVVDINNPLNPFSLSKP